MFNVELIQESMKHMAISSHRRTWETNGDICVDTELLCDKVKQRGIGVAFDFNLV